MDLTRKYSARKVPEITLIFWVTKLLTTAMGESTSDFLVFRINPYLAVLLGGVAFFIALMIQLRVNRYIPSVYWLCVAMVAVFGTMAADGLHIQLHVPYLVSAIFFAVVLIGVFIVWQKSENTLSIHSINTRKRELYYWATVAATFALGTAVGDLTATTFGLGYFSSAVLFGGLIILPAIGFWLFRLNEILTFWTAYVLTRPLGASFADWFGKSKIVGGLGWGDGRVAIVLSIIIIIFVCYMSFGTKDNHRRV